MTTRDHVPLEGRSSDAVYIRTLGAFSVTVPNGCATPWHSSSVGRRSLQQMLSYLVAKRGEYISCDDLIVVSGTNAQRPGYVLTGIVSLLREWRMEDALERPSEYIALHKHPSWFTDTDLLCDAQEQADQLIAANKPIQAIDVLAAAKPLCRGRYLPSFDSTIDYSIEFEADFWLQKQKQLLARLVSLQLEHTGNMDHTAVQTAQALVQLDHSDPASLQLAVAVARHVDNHRLADFYQRRLNSEE